MIYKKKEYLKVNTQYDNNSIGISLNGKCYRIEYPEKVWRPLDDKIKESIVDHIAFLSTNFLPLALDKKGVVYNTRLPMFDCFSFKNMMLDMPSNAVLDGVKTVDYLKRYLNLDFVFDPGEPVVWSKRFSPRKRAIISFTSGKDSLLTLAMCRELDLEPILINVVEPSNTFEGMHKAEIMRGLNREFGVECHMIPHEVGLFNDARSMGARETTLGWGSRLMYYLFLYLPFIIHHRARYLFYGNEYSCDKEEINEEGYRANYCYDQSSQWTMQMDTILRTLTCDSARVGSLVGPLNEIAVIKCLHSGFPELAKYQMSCFCDDPAVSEYRWCCNCSKCARNYAFIQAVDGDVKGVGFWRDMFSDDCLNLFSALGGKETFGFDSSGLGREEQEFALYLAHERLPENQFLSDFTERCRYSDHGGDAESGLELFKRDYDFYFGPQEYPAIPRELRSRVYEIYSNILLASKRMASALAHGVHPGEPVPLPLAAIGSDDQKSDGE